VRSLLATGLALVDTTGIGFKVAADGHLVASHGAPSHGLYYLGPWLRGRDLECSAVHELRQQATALAARLVSAVPASIEPSPNPSASYAPATLHPRLPARAQRARHSLYP
jgi:uncharacterized NAD(P)/FAD-binding protein YdhS